MDQDERLANLAKALSHPARIKIIKLLSSKCCICGEIVDMLPYSQATVSQHLKVLKEVGLISGQIDGPRVCYCLNKDCLKEIDGLYSELLK